MMWKIKEILSKVVNDSRMFNKETENCSDFEIFGFDIMITTEGEVHLLEINENPDFVITNPEKQRIYSNVFDKLFKFASSKNQYITSYLASQRKVEWNLIKEKSCKFNQMWLEQASSVNN